MNIKLNIVGGKVKYLNRHNGTVVGSDTSADNAWWIVQNGKVEKSDEFEGYPIAVKLNGNEYFLSGEWLMGGAKDVLGEDAHESAENAIYSRDSRKLGTVAGENGAGAERPQKRRRTKDIVLE